MIVLIHTGVTKLLGSIFSELHRIVQSAGKVVILLIAWSLQCTNKWYISSLNWVTDVETSIINDNYLQNFWYLNPGIPIICNQPLNLRLHYYVMLSWSFAATVLTLYFKKRISSRGPVSSSFIEITFYYLNMLLVRF